MNDINNKSGVSIDNACYIYIKNLPKRTKMPLSSLPVIVPNVTVYIPFCAIQSRVTYFPPDYTAYRYFTYNNSLMCCCL